MLRQVCTRIWVADHPLKLMGVRLGARMTVVALDEGALWLHSPVPIDDALASELASLGEVRWLVAPNRFHFMFLADAKKRYPDALAWIAPGLLRKRPNLVHDGTLDGPLPPEWSEDFDIEAIDGAPALDEYVFFHRPSRSLITTDLLFHITEPEGWWTRSVLALNGATGGPKQSKILRRTVKDREAFHASIERVAGLPFQRLMMAHGEIIEEGARDKLREAAAWAQPVTLAEPVLG